MATAYLIDNTAGTHSFVVLPGSLNGPGSAIGETDLRLYGLGASAWGEGINENFYRLTENFACPESVLNPGNPMDAVELGRPGHGINNPIQGQLWFNTTSGKLSVFNGTVWSIAGGVTSSSTPPPSPQIGDLWFDTANEELLVWNGTSWISTMQALRLDGSTAMTGDLNVGGFNIINLASGVNPTDAVNKGQLDSAIASLTTGLSEAVLRDGSVAMIANLNLNNFSVINLATGINPTDAVNKGQLDAAITPLLVKANNLSDLADITAARASLQLGTFATRNEIKSTTAPSGSASDGDVWFQYI